MNLHIRTYVFSFLAGLISFPLALSPKLIALRTEPFNLKWLYRKKEIPWADAMNGIEVLQQCPMLSPKNFAVLIDRQIKSENTGDAPIFATPYTLIENKGNAYVVALPATSTPHVIYKRFGSDSFDFSNVYFERKDVQKYLNEYQLEAAKGPRANLNHWEQTIEKCTRLLIAFYEGSQAPLTKDEAKYKTDANKQAFEAWWKNVPDKFKSGVTHSCKKKINDVNLPK